MRILRKLFRSRPAVEPPTPPRPVPQADPDREADR